MKIWEQSDRVRIAAAQQRLTDLLPLCPVSMEGPRADRDEPIDRLVRVTGVADQRRAA